MNQSITKAIHILKLYFDHRTLSVGEVAEIMNEHKSNISRIMKTMSSNDIIYQDPKSKTYRLGPMVLKLAYSMLGDTDIRGVAYPFMKKLNDDCNESILLCIISGDEVIQVEQIASKHSLMVFSEIGKSFSLFTGAFLNTTTGASARAIAAFMPWEDVKNRLIRDKIMIKKTNKHMPNLEAYRKQLESIRDKGVAVANCEINKGVIAISAPILNTIDSPIASLTVIGPDIRLDDERILTISEKLRRTAKDCSDALRTCSM